MYSCWELCWWVNFSLNHLMKKSLTNVLREVLTESVISSGSVQQTARYFAFYKIQASASEVHLWAYWNALKKQRACNIPFFLDAVAVARWLKYCDLLLYCLLHRIQLFFFFFYTMFVKFTFEIKYTFFSRTTGGQ